jgi:hypothetical protein
MNTLKTTMSKIAQIEQPERTDLAKHEVELAALDEIRAAELEPNKFMDKAIALKKEAQQNFIDAQKKYQEVIALCDKYIPMAETLGDPNAIKILKNKRKMANDMAKALKLDIDKLK